MLNLETELSRVSSAVIAGHIRPDGDCVGSCMGMYLDIKKNFPNSTRVNVFLEKIPEAMNFIKDSDKIRNDYPEEAPYDLFIGLDAGDTGRLGKAETYFAQAGRTICIDHHISNTGYADENYIVPSASSASELVYELIDPEKIDKSIAEALYMGIAHDTGVFQYSCCSPRTMEIAGKLIEKGINFPKIVDETFFTKTYNQNRIMGLALMKSVLHLDGKCISSVITKQEMEEYDVLPKHLDGIVSQLRVTKDVEVAIFLYELEDGEFKVSTRSKELVDLSEIAVKFDGGGHVRAAGFSMKGEPEQIIEAILEEVKKQL